MATNQTLGIEFDWILLLVTDIFFRFIIIHKLIILNHVAYYTNIFGIIRKKKLTLQQFNESPFFREWVELPRWQLFY